MSNKKPLVKTINHSRDLKYLISQNIPVIIFKKFVKSNDCYKLINNCHRFSKKIIHRKKYNNGKFYSLDVLPQNVKTDRIFRTFYLPMKTKSKYPFISKILQIQKKLITKILKTNKIRLQVIHYPIGGGFFGLHRHNRYPTNYGIILNLSKRGKDFISGETNIIYKKKNHKSWNLCRSRGFNIV